MYINLFFLNFLKKLLNASIKKNEARLKFKRSCLKFKFLFQKHRNIYFSQVEDHCGLTFICQNLNVLLLQWKINDGSNDDDDST